MRRDADRRYRRRCVASVRQHAGMATLVRCVAGDPDCPGPNAGGDDLPCFACLLRGADP